MNGRLIVSMQSDEKLSLVHIGALLRASQDVRIAGQSREEIDDRVGTTRQEVWLGQARPGSQGVIVELYGEDDRIEPSRQFGALRLVRESLPRVNGRGDSTTLHFDYQHAV